MDLRIDIPCTAALSVADDGFVGGDSDAGSVAWPWPPRDELIHQIEGSAMGRKKNKLKSSWISQYEPKAEEITPYEILTRYLNIKGVSNVVKKGIAHQSEDLKHYWMTIQLRQLQDRKIVIFTMHKMILKA